MTAPKLDIFRVLNAANEKDREFYSKLTEAEQKAFQPFLVMRWLSGTTDPVQIILINEFLNRYAFALSQHKSLFWQLTTACTSGKKSRYQWLKLPAKKDPSRPMSTKAVMDYYKYSTNDAIDALRLLTADDVIEIAEFLGWQKEDIAKVKKEMKGAGASDDEPKAKKKKPTEDAFEY